MQKNPRRLRTPQAADYIGLAASTLEKLRCYGGGPTYEKLGRIVVYVTTDLDAWADARRRISTSTSAPADGDDARTQP